MDETWPSVAPPSRTLLARNANFCVLRPCGTTVGSLNAYQWLQFIAAREKRQMKLMREIAETLPKTVTSLHK
jgi:hypothetical protein